MPASVPGADPRPGRGKSRQQGFALLIMLVIVVMGTLYAVTSQLEVAKRKYARDEATFKALARAKEALISWSVLNGDIGTGTSPRPGDLPCRDSNDDGSQESSCTSGAIGRLPWKTLGLDELRDADGEKLWYALSGNFRRANSNNNAINSDTDGTLLLYAANGTTLLTPPGEELAAIIFSAGPPVSGQNRATGPTVASNYLEAANGRNNATTGGPFISGPVKDAQGNVTLNDLVLGISARELMAAVEKRALKEAQTALAAYPSAHSGKYPNPARRNSTNCLQTIGNINSFNTCNSNSSYCFGRLPEDALSPYAAIWFNQNGWGRVLIYAVIKNKVEDGSAAECSTALSLDGQTKDYVLIAPGTARNGQTRPSSTLSDYLEDIANSDAWTSGGAGQPAFVTPTNARNDQLRSAP